MMNTNTIDSKKADAELPNRKERVTERDNWEDVEKTKRGRKVQHG